MKLRIYCQIKLKAGCVARNDRRVCFVRIIALFKAKDQVRRRKGQNASMCPSHLKLLSIKHSQNYLVS